MLVFVESIMDRGLEGKDENYFYCVSYIKSKSPKKSIMWNVSKPAETTDIPGVLVCIQALCEDISLP
jgi:hypothetical protein